MQMTWASLFGQTNDDRWRTREEKSPTLGRCGQLRMRLWYNTRTCTLTVSVVEAKELPMRRGVGRTCLPHPYLKVCLLPNRRLAILYLCLFPRTPSTKYAVVSACILHLIDICVLI